MIEFRTHQDGSADSVRSEWELLTDEDPHATLFQGPRYLATWRRVLAPGTPVRVHTVRRDGRLIGVIPDANEREGSPTGPVEVRRFQGGTEVTDYLGPVSRMEDRTDVADAYLANLMEDVDWDEFVAGGLVQDGSWAEALRRSAPRHGLQVIEEAVEDVCPVLELHGGYDAYLERLPGRQRQELNRKSRKLARDAGDLSLVEVPPEEVVDQVDDFLDQAAQSHPEKAGFFEREEMHAWFRGLAEEFVPDRIFRLHRLDVGGLPAASTVSLVHRGRWGLYNSAFDPTLGSLAPGIVLVSLLIEQAAEEGCTTFDLLRGAEPYKYRFGAVDRPLKRLTLGRG